MVSHFLVWETSEIELFLENERQESHGEKLSLRQAVAEVTEGHPCEELSYRKLTSPTLFAHTWVGSGGSTFQSHLSHAETTVLCETTICTTVPALQGKRWILRKIKWPYLHSYTKGELALLGMKVSPRGG